MKNVWDCLLKKSGYRVRCTIGEGAYSKVKLAYSKGLRKNVAIKCISFHNAPKEFIVKFLPRELNTLAMLNHKNIIHVYEVIERYDTDFRNSFVCIVMEYAKNGDMLNYIQNVGAMPIDEVKTCFLQLCHAVRHCHAKGICHRDLKCENLLLGKHNQVILSDFGFCKPVIIDMKGNPELSATFCGSAAYAAPETLKGKPYNPFMHDIWSLGVILFIMTSGHMPFDDSNVVQMMLTQNQGYINQLIVMRCGESKHLKHLIGLLLQVDVRKRATINEILHHPFFKYNGDDAMSKKTDPNFGVKVPGNPYGSCGLSNTEGQEKENSSCFTVRSRELSRFSLPTKKDWQRLIKAPRMGRKSKDVSVKKRATSKSRKKSTKRITKKRDSRDI